MLTEQLVLTRCKCDKLGQVKNLNMWGSELEDVSLVKDMPNLEICSLSLNKISSLYAFQQCRKLTELYLRKNSIENLSDIRYLANLPLKVIWLVDNPICNHPNYRQYIIKVLPNLVKLDNTEVKDEERKACAQLSESELLKSSANEVNAYASIHHNKSVEQAHQVQSETKLNRADSATPSTSAAKNISSGASNHSRVSSSQVSQQRHASANLRSKSPKILPQGGVTNQASQPYAAAANLGIKQQ